MEAQGGAEVRRIHIVYLLSRKGHTEHPHLIRVHHLSRNGVHLRDVKRWLGDLRGKDMPDSFSWSYKRRYKGGHVWQDLVDDDLITPLSDNEYVLKGSEISSTHKVGKEEQKTSSYSSETSLHVSTKSSCEIEEESPTFGSETSTLTDDSARADTAERISEDGKIKFPSALYSTLFSKKNKNKNKIKKVATDHNGKMSTKEADSYKLASSTQPKSKNHSNGASQMLKNLITCGDVDTNDSVKAINKQNKPLLTMCSGDLGSIRSGAISKRDSFGGSQSQRVFGNPNWIQPKWGSRRSFDGIKDSSKGDHLRVPCPAYKPVNGPNCSQCGKAFKPEKLHGHMKSCKGMKGSMSKCAADKPSKEFGQRDAVSGHLVSH